MSNTPRTDAWKWTNDPIDELYGFARQLERELNAANERIKRLEEAGDAMVETTTTPAAEAWNKAKEAKAVSEYEHNEHLLDEIDRLRESNFHLRKGCEELKHRITQLEQENDAMRADLLLWGDNLRLQQRINKLEQENDALRADLLLWNEKECK